LTDLYEIWYVDAKMGFLTGPTVKKSKFQKFETADAAILKKNIFLQLFDHFLIKFGTGWRILVPRTWRKVKAVVLSKRQSSVIITSNSVAIDFCKK